MCESTIDTSDYEDKMSETATPSALQVSVSFSRFESDSLSWERFSTFSPNKYLEEVENCATLGSVAEKRAYFEAHYKKIAAGKAEPVDQDMQNRNANLRSPRDLSSGDLTGNPSAYDTSNSQDSKAFEQETDLVGEVSNNHAGESDGDASVVIECLSSDLDDRLNIPRFDSMVRGEAPKIDPRDIRDQPQNMDNETGNAMKSKDVYVKSTHPKPSHKIAAANKEKSTALVKKKSASPVTKATQMSTPRASKPAQTKAQQISTPHKAPQFSTLRVSKPAPTPTVMRSSTKKEHASPIARKKTQSAGDSKRAPPKSPVVDHDNFAHSLTTTRQSLIMERMGDKDIVKRAFKTFQNNFNHLKSYREERSSMPEQGSTRDTELRVSGTMNMHKDNGGSIKASGMEKGNAKAAPSSFEKPQEQKEYSHKLEGKSNTGQIQPKFKKGFKNQSHQ